MTCRSRSSFWLMAVAAMWVASASAAPPTAEETEFFEKHVRPVLVERCGACHGAKKQESELRLDSREAVLKGGSSGPAAIPGKPDDSELVMAIRHEGALKMPPAGKLPQTEIDALTRWVAMGMPWPAQPAASTTVDPQAWKRHWAFQPIRRPALPWTAPASTQASVGAAADMAAPPGWPQTPLDLFVWEKLRSQGMTPSAPAERRTLIRRLSFDLLGLPPAPEDVDAFLNDHSPQAYERLVDRYLASPRYGERWGRHWLDVARYADNKGYVFFEDKNYPFAYTYRDYVVRAWNDDLPYDRFILEQLAADQLPRTDAQSLAAMGFVTVGAHFMNNVHDIMDDRIDVVTRGLMGLTATCARCHDHKYDPIPQTDYYALYGVFRSSFEPDVPPELAPPQQGEAYQKFMAELELRYGRLRKFIDDKYEQLVRSGRSRVAEYLLAAHAQRNQPSTEDFMLLTDAGELNPALITRWRIYLEKKRKARDSVWLPWHALAEVPEAEFAARAPAILEEVLGENAPVPVNPRVREALLASPVASMAELATRYGEVLNGVDRKWQEVMRDVAPVENPAIFGHLGDLPLASEEAAAERENAAYRAGIPQALSDPADEELRQVFYGEDAPPNVPLSFGWGFLTLLPDRPAQAEYQKLLKEVETWIATGPGAPPRAMVLLDQPQPYEPRVFLRGNSERLGPPVSRRFLQSIEPAGQPFTRGSGRLELARAIVDPRNPLTARVLVNRLWGHHFGTGLVRTPGDFGLRSEPPTHAALLDYLAYELIAQGWSIKAIQRQIVLSATYRQSSADRPDCRQRDPEVRWLWKYPRRRLDFEALRDAMVVASGRWDGRMGGPPQPMFGGEVVFRRSLYGFIDRMDVPPLLTTFDFPNPHVSSASRESTTVAPQALYFMNSNFVSEVAQSLWQRGDVNEAGDLPAQIERLYSLLYGRPPSEPELAAANEFLGATPDAGRKMAFAQALLLANEFAFVD